MSGYRAPYIDRGEFSTSWLLRDEHDNEVELDLLVKYRWSQPEPDIGHPGGVEDYRVEVKYPGMADRYIHIKALGPFWQSEAFREHVNKMAYDPHEAAREHYDELRADEAREAL